VFVVADVPQAQAGEFGAAGGDGEAEEEHGSVAESEDVGVALGDDEAERRDAEGWGLAAAAFGFFCLLGLLAVVLQQFACGPGGVRVDEDVVGRAAEGDDDAGELAVDGGVGALLPVPEVVDEGAEGAAGGGGRRDLQLGAEGFPGLPVRLVRALGVVGALVVGVFVAGGVECGEACAELGVELVG
jgi:hypothetical protein